MGGEEYKNQLLVGFLEKKYPLDIIDTIFWKKRPFVILQLIYSLFLKRYRHIIISASSASAYTLIKFLNAFPGLLKKTMYLVIGGYFPGAVLNNRYKAIYYQKLKKIVVEGTLLKNILDQAGLSHNSMVMYNFKPVMSYLHAGKNNIERPHAVFRFVFVSRISDSKGVGLIFKAIEHLNQLQTSIPQYQVDFYGPVEEDYQTEFNAHLKKFSNCNYKGYLDIMGNPEMAYARLSTYQCFLFPTFWAGEGFPGVFIDAYIAGLPVIASAWNMNAEVVLHQFNGLIVPAQNPLALMKAMQFVLENPNTLSEWRLNCLRSAPEYAYHEILTNNLLEILN